MDLLDELDSRIICGDGAIGTLLLDAGASLDRCLEEICVSDPDRVRAIHDQYIAAGARVIETNTFGANAVRLERFGLEGRVGEINKEAANLARQSAGGKNVYVAGSVGPLGISAEEANARGIDREGCFHDQVNALLEGGVELIFFETFMDFDEMAIAFRATKDADCLTICSFACAPEGRLSSGMLLVDAFVRLRKIGADIVGVNCMNGPHGMVELLQRVPVSNQLLAAYPNAGCPKYTDGRFIYHTAPDYFARAAREMVAEGARLIGGCCGTNPRHVAAISAAIADLQPVRSKSVRVAAEALPRIPKKEGAATEEGRLERIARESA
jgi:methionine synthase I (cobalamin-dependent)